MTALVTTQNLSAPDDFYERLIKKHPNNRYLDAVRSGELIEWVQLGKRVRLTTAGAKHPVMAGGKSVRGWCPDRAPGRVLKSEVTPFLYCPKRSSRASTSLAKRSMNMRALTWAAASV